MHRIGALSHMLTASFGSVSSKAEPRRNRLTRLGVRKRDLIHKVLFRFGFKYIAFIAAEVRSPKPS